MGSLAKREKWEIVLKSLITLGIVAAVMLCVFFVYDRVFKADNELRESQRAQREEELQRKKRSSVSEAVKIATYSYEIIKNDLSDFDLDIDLSVEVPSSGGFSMLFQSKRVGSFNLCIDKDGNHGEFSKEKISENSSNIQETDEEAEHRRELNRKAKAVLDANDMEYTGENSHFFLTDIIEVSQFRLFLVDAYDSASDYYDDRTEYLIIYDATDEVVKYIAKLSISDEFYFSSKCGGYRLNQVKIMP